MEDLEVTVAMLEDGGVVLRQGDASLYLEPAALGSLAGKLQALHAWWQDPNPGPPPVPVLGPDDDQEHNRMLWLEGPEELPPAPGVARDAPGTELCGPELEEHLKRCSETARGWARDAEPERLSGG